MANSHFATVAAEVKRELTNHRLVKTGTVDRDAEWQRVNSYVADVLKDTHVLYAKLARLQGDFVGHELEELEKISESVLSLGEELSQFSKAFYEGKLQMAESDMAYGTPSGGQPGGPHGGPPPHGAPPGHGAPPPPPPPPPEDYDVPVEVEEEEAPRAHEEQEQEQEQD